MWSSDLKSDNLKLRWLIAITLLVNAAALLNPLIVEGDSVTYAALAQHMAVHNNWADLMLDGRSWLDKPHFPFWVTALSFELLGPSSFAYSLPGFLFHLMGGYFTYRIARLLFDRNTALLALLVFLSAYHVMYTSSAVKAEAFLTGTITGACYYWLRFDADAKWKYLVLGAAFSAMSVMTKGVCTLITITSGLVCMWLYLGQWRKLWSAKWLLAAVLTCLFMAPELMALYLQFDVNPQKNLLGQDQVSGIRFFLWDSQLGRFFKSGVPSTGESSPLYFVHVFLWAFMPWVLAFVAALVDGARRFAVVDKPERAKLVFLVAAFFTTFTVFSAAEFQLDYYTVILYPFAAILCGQYLQRWLSQAGGRGPLVAMQALTTLLIVGFAVGMAIYVERSNLLLIVLVPLALMLAGAMRCGIPHSARAVVVYPVLAVCILYAFVGSMTFTAQQAYGVAYNVSKLLPPSPLPIVMYRVDEITPRELALYRGLPCCLAANAPSQLPGPGSRYLLVIKAEHMDAVRDFLGNNKTLAEGEWIDHKTGLLPRMLRMAKGDEPLEKFRIVEVGV